MDHERDGRQSDRGNSDSRGKTTREPASRSDDDYLGADDIMEEGSEQSGPIPDMVRKALTMGLAGFFSTEQTIRKALGDTMPREWIDFVSDQSERTRGDLTQAIASEVGRSLRAIDLTRVADQLLSGRTLEVSARIRLLPLDDEVTNPTEPEATDPEGSDS